ncbi:MAG: hypothetical protein Q9187_009296, partial [Circinaria calcarea]
MEEDFSGSTARPATDSQDEGWETVRSKQKTRKTRRRYDLGNFRPALAKVEVNRGYATGSVTKLPHERRGRLSSSSDAVNALTAVQRASPPSSGDGRSVLSQSRSPAPSRPSYAKVLKGQWQRLSSSHLKNASDDTSRPEEVLVSTPAVISERGRSRESRNRLENVQQPPLRMENFQSSTNPHSPKIPISPPLLSSQ